MEQIKEFLQLDFSAVIISIFLVMSAIISGYKIIGEFSKIIGKPVKWVKNKEKDHEVLLQTVKELHDLRDKHNSDEADIKQCLADFISETRETIKKQDKTNREHWETSKQIRKELTDTIKTISDDNQTKGEQINSLIVANKEMLAEKINEKYKYYLSIQGIPEDEYDEFRSLHKAYNGVGGNSNGDAKFEYCMKNLKIIPVETKLVIKHKENK